MKKLMFIAVLILINIFSVQLFSQIEPVTNLTASATSYYQTYTSNYAVDNSTSTYWMTMEGSAYLTITMPAACIIANFTITWGNPWGNGTTIELYNSTTLVQTLSHPNYNPPTYQSFTNTFTPTSQPVTSLKIKTTAYSSGSPTIIQEVSINRQVTTSNQDYVSLNRLGIGTNAYSSRLTLQQSSGTNNEGIQLKYGTANWYMYTNAANNLTLSQGTVGKGVTLNNTNGALTMSLGDYWTSGQTSLVFKTSASAGGYSSIQSTQSKGVAGGTLLLNPESGKVGIGVTPISEKLEVAGNVKATKFIGDGSGLTGIAGLSQWTTNGSNIYYNLGFIGIGTDAPQANLHVKSTTSHSYIAIDKANSSSEGGIQFRTANNVDFYLFSDNADNSALKIQASGLDGEGDATPRIMIPKDNKNISLALSGGNVLIGKTTPSNTSNRLEVEGSAALNGNLYAVGDMNLGGNLILDGANNWILHTPDGTGDTRTSLYIAPKGGENWDWAKQTRFDNNGNVVFSGNIGIGIEPQVKLHVNGDLRVDGEIFHRGVLKSKEINVELPNSGWKDYVFDKSYKLMTLGEVEQFIKTNGHLPEIPSAGDVEKNGINIGDMQAKLLQKIEELTLYNIELCKRIEALEKVNALQK